MTKTTRTYWLYEEWDGGRGTNLLRLGTDFDQAHETFVSLKTEAEAGLSEIESIRIESADGDADPEIGANTVLNWEVRA